ncbi:MAG TPA: hypothetical protein PLM07_16605, partial [Candidatus Rifleibacterium sp.]|nr:hypothetical protein [Candidatus Rifleibacterium sp.]
MAKKRVRNIGATETLGADWAAQASLSLLQMVEDALYKLFRKSNNETRANLSATDWVIYIGLLLVVLIMPFLYSRATTENFLTPKEFFSKISIALLAGIYCARIFTRRNLMLARTSLDFPLVLFFGFAALSVMW